MRAWGLPGLQTTGLFRVRTEQGWRGWVGSPLLELGHSSPILAHDSFWLLSIQSLGLHHWSLSFLWDYITDHSPFWGHITDHFPFSGITSPTTSLSLGSHHWPRPLPWDYITGHSPFSRIMTLTISLSLGLHHWPYPFSGSQAFGPSLVIAPISLAFHLVDSRNVNLQPL